MCERVRATWCPWGEHTQWSRRRLLDCKLLSSHARHPPCCNVLFCYCYGCWLLFLRLLDCKLLSSVCVCIVDQLWIMNLLCVHGNDLPDQIIWSHWVWSLKNFYNQPSCQIPFNNSGLSLSNWNVLDRDWGVVFWGRLMKFLQGSVGVQAFIAAANIWAHEACIIKFII